jgi:hypothetical protein
MGGAPVAIVVRNTRFEFSGTYGALTDMVVDGNSLLLKSADPRPLWSIGIGTDKTYVARVAGVGAVDPDTSHVAAASFDAQVVEMDRYLVLTWSFAANSGNPPIDVTVNISAHEEQPVVLLSLIASSHDSPFAVGDVEFPKVAGVTGDSDNHLVWPYDAGFLQSPVLGLGNVYTNSDNRANPGINTFPGLAMQFLAFYSTMGGFYLSAQDGDGYLKKFLVNGGDPSSGLSLSCGVRHYQPDPGTLVYNYVHPYSVALAGFQGDWQDAADIYRAWARKQKWCRFGRLSERNDCMWIKNCAMFYYAKNWALPVADQNDKPLIPSNDPVYQTCHLPVPRPADWQPGTAYVPWAMVLYNNQVYICRTANPDLSQPPSKAKTQEEFWWAWGLPPTLSPLSKAAASLRSMVGASHPIGMHWSDWCGRSNEDGPLYEPRPEAVDPQQLGTRGPGTLWGEVGAMRQQDFHILGYISGVEWAIGATAVAEPPPPCGWVAPPDAGPSHDGWHGWNAEGSPNAVNVLDSTDCKLARAGGDARPADYVPVLPYQGVVMCPGTTYWQNRIASEASRICTYGGDGAYIDGGGIAPALPCSADHGHPIGGGTWWSDGFHTAIAKLRAMATNLDQADFAISTEGCVELYIDMYNLFLTQYRNEWWRGNPSEPVLFPDPNALLPQPIPLFQYVYHPYTYVYNMAVWLTSELGDLRKVYAHVLNEGSILEEGEETQAANNGAYFNPGLTSAINGQADPEVNKKKNIALLRSYVQLRGTLLKYLNLGDMLRVPKAIPSGVVSSAWEAPDGDLAFIFSNPSDQNLTAKWIAPANQYGLPTPGKWVATYNGKPLAVSLPPPWHAQDFIINLPSSPNDIQSQTLVLEWRRERCRFVITPECEEIPHSSYESPWLGFASSPPPGPAGKPLRADLARWIDILHEVMIEHGVGGGDSRLSEAEVARIRDAATHILEVTATFRR